VRTTTVRGIDDEVRWRLEPHSAAPSMVRRQLVETFAAWGIAEEQWQGPLLVANELVTNAVEHARTPFEVTVRFDGSIVAIQVTDRSPAPPQLRRHDPNARRGRGMQVVAALSERWCWIPHARGKTIRAEVVPQCWCEG
jgi:anti-sigma regulatory factor (Ser/Thr protein kinase)